MLAAVAGRFLGGRYGGETGVQVNDARRAVSGAQAALGAGLLVNGEIYHGASQKFSSGHCNAKPAARQEVCGSFLEGGSGELP